MAPYSTEQNSNKNPTVQAGQPVCFDCHGLASEYTQDLPWC